MRNIPGGWKTAGTILFLLPGIKRSAGYGVIKQVHSFTLLRKNEGVLRSKFNLNISYLVAAQYLKLFFLVE